MDSSSDLEPLDASEEAAHVLSEEDQPDVPVKRPRRPPRTLTYKLVRNFDDQTKFNDGRPNMADWHDNSEYSRGTTGEAVEVFACSTSGCPMRRRVVYDAYSFVVKVEDATVDHDHPAEESVLSKAQIKTIESLLQNGMKPAAIRLKMLFLPLFRAESDDEDALPAPPAFTSESHAAGVSSADSAAQTASSHSEVTSPAGAQAGGTSSSRASGGPERLASITTHIHGYNEPLLWTKSKLKSNAFGASPSVEANKENTHEKEAPRLIDSTITTYQSSFVADKADRPHHTFGMSADEPPTEAPPPPPLSHPIGESRGFADGADEFMSERSRSHNAVRDIPVQIQRATDPFGASYSSTTTGGMPGFPLPHHGTSTTAWTATRYDPVTNAPQQEEYYRREVMTRTLVTRSTEALSAPPPLSRSSPIDQLRPLPDPRDEITEEFRVKYTRNIEEEERRIRESQDKRRQEEEERRRRIDDLRRGLEQQEAERLERLRIEREKIEKANRIERDRQLREEEERRRRLAWEKMEEERRRLEEAEIAKRRQLEEIEKERLRREKLRLEELERQRIEAERRRLEELEKQRLERERIEKERIEIERLEIERIERIKREQREREERDREAARLAAEKLAKERAGSRASPPRNNSSWSGRSVWPSSRRAERPKSASGNASEISCSNTSDANKNVVTGSCSSGSGQLVEARERERRKKELEEAARLEALRREQERLEFERLEALRREEKRKEDEVTSRTRTPRTPPARTANVATKNDSKKKCANANAKKRNARPPNGAIGSVSPPKRRSDSGGWRSSGSATVWPAWTTPPASGTPSAKLERRREAERIELERRTKELQDIEKMQQQRREQERQEEERRLAELQALERRKAQERDRERELANEREQERRLQDRRSQDHLQEIAREREKKEQWAMERLRLLRLHEESEKKRQDLTSKETLERLTRKPYYSTEKLSAIGLPGSLHQGRTTSERRRGMTWRLIEGLQVFERVDKTLWTSNDRFPESSLPALPDSHDGPPRERLFANNNASQDDDDFRRGGSNRTSKYKANIQKARRDYFADGGPTADYRGPLLQQFHNGELGTRTHYDPPTSTYNYAKSPYDQEYQRLIEKAERQLAAYRQRLSQPSLQAGGYLGDGRRLSAVEFATRRRRLPLEVRPRLHAHAPSRRDLTDPEAEASHSRSKSADYLMDARLREDAAPPENELQKTADGLYPPTAAPILTEHEQRYRKSVERLHTGAPDYYAGRAAPPTNLSQTTTADQRSSGYGSRPYSRQQYETSPPALHEGARPAADLGSPVGGISFPRGFFDKYAGEIEDMRRSRSSLHQVDLPPPVPSTIVDSKYSKEYARELLPGYTVSTVPTDWNWPRERTSRVIEVADTFIGRPGAPRTNKYGGRVTIEEVLDAIFQQTNPSNIPADPSETSPPPPHNVDGPGIYTTNERLMDRVIKEPSMAEELLRNEPLVVRCTNCKKTRGIAEARQYYVSCKHCYTYYCSRGCRAEDWPRHKDRCSFARINTLCKEVIMKVRKDATTQYHMSKVARDGYRREGRGSVNIRFLSAHSAQSYLDDGWDALLRVEDPNELLFYYPIQTLMDQRKEPSLIQLCRKYSPQEKFILSVSIIADIEQCPETPPPEPSDARYSTINKPLRPSFDRYGALVPTDV
ncbi:hypothetical protein M3Y99_00066000 [Aphelenchoides fujianensis]|nr:hypothetical protein M3Y99_00066000 [Aphelenchoides fujianensis]